jgi:hypothetical protein
MDVEAAGNPRNVTGAAPTGFFFVILRPVRPIRTSYSVNPDLGSTVRGNQAVVFYATLPEAAGLFRVEFTAPAT